MGALRLYRHLSVGVGLVLVASVALLSGCQGRTAAPSAVQDVELERRATDLLLRAAQNSDPVVASNAIEALVKVAPDEGRPHIRAALRSEYPLVRFASLVALGTLRDKQSGSALKQYLSDPNQMVRLGAAYALYRTKTTGAARLLVNTLKDNPDEGARAEAAHLIGLLGEPQAAKHLRSALRIKANEDSDRVQVEVHAALGRLGDDRAVWWLYDRAKGVDPLVRLMALQALADLRVDVAAEVFEYHMSREETYLVHRLVAARGLARLGSPAGYQLALKSTEFVGKNPDDPEETMRVRSNAALVLGEIRDPRALGVLKRMAETETDPRVQVAASYAICRILAR
ncbi:MAG: HEAT repeat domain-containing protein [Planctomycetota bacterium]